MHSVVSARQMAVRNSKQPDELRGDTLKLSSVVAQWLVSERRAGTRLALPQLPVHQQADPGGGAGQTREQERARESKREGLTRRTLSFLQQRASQRRHGQTARSVRGAKSKASREASTQTGSSVPSQRTRSPSAEGRERRRPSHAVLMFREGTEERNAVRTRNRGRRRGSRVHLMSEDLPVIWT